MKLKRRKSQFLYKTSPAMSLCPIARDCNTWKILLVRKSDFAIVQRVIADKQRMTVSAPGGTHEVDVPRFLRNTSSLSDEQVIEMAKVALTLETTMENPVDVECAYAGGELYLLQCRPITTLQ